MFVSITDRFIIGLVSCIKDKSSNVKSGVLSVISEWQFFSLSNLLPVVDGEINNGGVSFSCDDDLLWIKIFWSLFWNGEFRWIWYSSFS